MPALPDGTFDVFIVDATVDDDDETAATLELALVSGEHKGDVVTVRMRTGGRDPVAVIGLPGTLTVTEGQPSLRIEA